MISLRTYIRHAWQVRDSEIVFLIRTLAFIFMAYALVGSLEYATERDIEAARHEAAAQRATRMVADCLSDRLVLSTGTVAVRCLSMEIKL